MLSPHDFFVQNVDSCELETIEEKIAASYDKLEKLKAPIMDRTFCLAPFDGGIYRAQIIRKKKDNLYDVQFIDYGNKDTIPVSELFKTPPAVATYKPQAIRCSLAYVECAPEGHDLFQSSLNVAMKLCWEQKLVIHTVSKDDEYHYVVIQPFNKPEMSCSLNYTLIEMALARVSPWVPPKGSLLEELTDVYNTATDKNGLILTVFDGDNE